MLQIKLFSGLARHFFLDRQNDHFIHLAQASHPYSFVAAYAERKASRWPAASESSATGSSQINTEHHMYQSKLNTPHG